MRNMEESNEFCLYDGEGMHIFKVCPKDAFAKVFYSNVTLYISDTAFPIEKKKLKLIM